MGYSNFAKNILFLLILFSVKNRLNANCRGGHEGGRGDVPPLTFKEGEGGEEEEDVFGPQTP